MHRYRLGNIEDWIALESWEWESLLNNVPLQMFWTSVLTISSQHDQHERIVCRYSLIYDHYWDQNLSPWAKQLLSKIPMWVLCPTIAMLALLVAIINQSSSSLKGQSERAVCWVQLPPVHGRDLLNRLQEWSLDLQDLRSIFPSHLRSSAPLYVWKETAFWGS